jgi:hypothetical protein
MPRGVRYDLPMGEVIASPEVQALLCDWSILSVAQSYLRARPIADVMAFWWTTAFNAQPSPAAAQYFHFDMDRIKWLKFFIYLTDVGPDAGPHAFIAGSHRTGGTPQSLLDRGYVRLPDGDVRACFPKRVGSSSMRRAGPSSRKTRVGSTRASRSCAAIA